MKSSPISAFGQTVASSGSSTDPDMFGATSEYRSDGDAGLVKVGCRYYDPEVGRFTTRDTELTQKAYVYCEGDPVNAVDPSGHSTIGAIAGGTATIVLGALGLTLLTMATGGADIPIIIAVGAGAGIGAVSSGLGSGLTTSIDTHDPTKTLQPIKDGALKGGMAGAAGPLVGKSLIALRAALQA